MKKNIKELPHPEIVREPCVSHCQGCERIFENYALPEGTILVDVCMAYQDPSIKWKDYRKESEIKKVGSKEKEIFYHYNPCPLATHVEHSPKEEEKRLRVKRK